MANMIIDKGIKNEVQVKTDTFGAAGFGASAGAQFGTTVPTSDAGTFAQDVPKLSCKICFAQQKPYDPYPNSRALKTHQLKSHSD